LQVQDQVAQQSQRAHTAGWGLEATYAVHLGIMGKPTVDFLLVISLDVTAEAL